MINEHLKKVLEALSMLCHSDMSVPEMTLHQRIKENVSIADAKITDLTITLAESDQRIRDLEELIEDMRFEAMEVHPSE